MLFKKARVIHDPVHRQYIVEIKRHMFSSWRQDSWVQYWSYEHGGPSHARPLSEEDAKNTAIKRAERLSRQEVIWSV